MSLWRIAWRSIQYRGLASALTALSMALGIALVVTVLVMHGVVNRAFSRTAQGFDLIVGPKGGRLELVLNTLFHLGRPVGKIPWSYYREFRPGGKFAGQVSVALPVCLGDSYEGHRVIGTVREFFRVEYAPGERYRFAAGRNLAAEHFFEAVIGSQVARRTGLTVGSSFEPTHGIGGDGHKHDAFKVVGILSPTGTHNDFALFVNIEGFYLLDGHAEETKEPAPKAAAETPPATPVANSGGDRAPAASPLPHQHDHAHDHHAHDDHDHAHHHDPLPESQRAVSAILVRTSNPMYNAFLPRKINEDVAAQAVLPTREVATLFDGLVGDLRTVLLILAVLVVIVASVGVMVSIYNSMHERRRELAIMRSLGASRSKVWQIVLIEALLLSLLGAVAGWAVGHGLLALLSPWVEAETGVSLGAGDFPMYDIDMGTWYIPIPIELVLLPGVVVAAALAGLLPAWTAYRTDVSRALAS